MRVWVICLHCKQVCNRNSSQLYDAETWLSDFERFFIKLLYLNTQFGFSPRPATNELLMGKSILFPLLLAFILFSCSKGTNNATTCNFIDFKYYNDAKYRLGELSTNYIMVSFDTNYSEIEMRKFVSSVTHFDQQYIYKFPYPKITALKLNQTKTCEQITAILAELQKNPIVAYAHYTMTGDNCRYQMMPTLMKCVNSYADEFIVKVFDENNLTDLQKLMAETKTELVLKIANTPNRFILKATKNSKADALKMANYFYESKLVKSAEPIMLSLPLE